MNHGAYAIQIVRLFVDTWTPELRFVWCLFAAVSDLLSSLPVGSTFSGGETNLVL